MPIVQRYENKPNEQGVAKRILLEFLDYLRYKVENDKLTMEEVEGFSRMLQENLPLSGTIADFAEYYKKPEVNVRVAINQRMMSKPVRRVFYSFNAFRKCIPNSWKKSKD